MATWVKAIKAQWYAPIIKKYQKQSTFMDAVKKEALNAKVWARVEPGEPAGGDSNLQVDVTAIPKVRPLTDTGHIK